MLPFLKLDFFKTNLISTLEFKKSELRIEEIDNELCGFNFSDKISWKFNSETQSLQFSNEDNLIAEYIINSKKTELTKWNNNSAEKHIELSAEIMTLELSKLINN